LQPEKDGLNALLLGNQKLPEGGAGEEKILPTVSCRRCAPLSAGRDTLDRTNERVALGVSQSRRRDNSPPVRELQIDPLLAQSRRIDVRYAPRR
jgi:hypothetical protein